MREEQLMTIGLQRVVVSVWSSQRQSSILVWSWVLKNQLSIWCSQIHQQQFRDAVKRDISLFVFSFRTKWCAFIPIIRRLASVAKET